MFNWLISHSWLLGFYILTIWTSTPYVIPIRSQRNIIKIIFLLIPVLNMFYAYSMMTCEISVEGKSIRVRRYFVLVTKMIQEKYWFIDNEGILEKNTPIRKDWSTVRFIFTKECFALSECNINPHYLWDTKFKTIYWVKWLNPIYYLTALQANKF